MIHPSQFDLEDLPDKFSQAEALWMVSCLAHAYALCGAYYQIMQDRKAWADWDRVCSTIERSINRIYPPSEADFMIQLGKQKGDQGVKAQIKLMKEAESMIEKASKSNEAPSKL